MSDKVHILYMEDNEGIARLLQKRLERVGFTIDLAPDGEAGLEMSAQQSYDMIIVDYNMPGLNGLQVIQRLSERTPMPPTIMLTGTGNEQIAVEALKYGAYDYVVKDIDAVYLDLLPTVVEQGLQTNRLLREKRLAEEKLEQSEKYYRTLIENSPDLIILLNESGTIRYVSPAFQGIFGFSEQTVIGNNALTLIKNNLPFFVEENNPSHLRDYYQSLFDNANEPIETEFRILDANGNPRWLEVRGRNLLHEPWIQSVVFNIRDITERKQAEEALRESEERFRMLFELAPDPYFINDLEGNLLDCNQAVEPLLGLRKTQLVGKNFMEMQIFDPDELGKVASILVNLSTGTPTRPPELIVNRADGQKSVIDLRMIPIQTKGQTQILGIGHDITWRKQAEVRMKTYINQLENLRQIDDELTRKLDTQYVQTMALTSMMNLSGAHAGSIALMDERGLSNLYSQGYSKVLDEKVYLEKQPIIVRAVQEQKAEWIENVSNHSDDPSLLENAYSQMIFPLVSQHRLVGIINLETIDAGRFTAELFDFLKLIAARIAVAIDNAYLYESQQQQLIELQNLYEKISRLEQLKTDMIRLAAHDLRNPLTSILAKTYMLRKTIGESVPENHQRYLEGINDAVGQIQSMITDFLSVERIEEITQGVLSAQEIDLQNLVQSVLNGFRVQFDEKLQTCHLSDFDAPIMVKGIKAELQQAIINIVGNAVKYTPDHGNIDISLQKQNGNVRFEVKDTGFGIPREQQERIFQPFFRAHSDETKSIEGTGLGLYLVKRIVERNGGQILFSSEYGVGSTFGFELPLSAG